MNEEPKKTIDVDTLLAFRDGSLDASTQQQVEERLRFSSEDREQLAAFDRDLELMKSAIAGNEQDIAPDLWAIRRKVHATNRRGRMVRASVAAAAVLALVAVGTLAFQDRRTIPVPRQAAVDRTDAEYLHAAVAQLEYETGLLRAQIEKTRVVRSGVPSAPKYADTAAILLESARYWGKPGGDVELSKARYEEILAHFPESSAAAAVMKERPAILFGDQPL